MPLENLERRQFMSKIRSAMIDRIERGGRPPAYTGGPTGGKFGVMTGSQPTAAESTAFNQRVRDRALHGDRWNTNGGMGRPGIMREQIDAKSLSDIAGRQMTPKQRTDVEQKRRQLDIAAVAAGEAPNFGRGTDQGAGDPGKITTLPYKEGTAPQTTTLPYTPGTRPPNTLLGEKLPTPPAPALRDVAPATPRFGGGGITVPPVREGEYRDPRIAPPGTYSSPGEYDPGLGQRIRAQIEGGGQAPEVGGPMSDAGRGVSLADVARPPASMTDSDMWTGYGDVPLKDVVPGTVAKGQAPMGITEAAGRTLADMALAAPRAIGKDNLSAGWNTVKDMFYKAPKETVEKHPDLFNALLGRLSPEVISGMERAIGKGAGWLSRQVLGGVR